jgi:hypothetical protein
LVLSEAEKREELKKALRKAIALLGDISEKIDEASSTLSAALSLAGYREEVVIPEHIRELEKEAPPPKPITFEKKEERVAEISTVLTRPIDSKFKNLEELVQEGTHIKSMCNELDNIRDWVMGLSPTQSSVLYQITQWSRKLRNYPQERLSDQDGGELMYSIRDWKARLSKI